MRNFIPIIFSIIFLLSACNSPTREMFFNAGIDYAFDQLQKAHPGGTIKAALPKNSFELYQTPWGFLDYRIIIVKDSSSRDSLIIPYHINYPTIKDTAKNFIKKLINKKAMSKKSQANADVLQTKFWALESDFINRMSSIGIRQLNQGNSIVAMWDDVDVDVEDEPKVIDRVRIIGISGTMSARGSYSAKGTKQIADEIREANQNPQISAIVIDCNSMGGSVDAIQQLHKEIYYSDKPIVAIANDNMHSAAYWACCGADYIYANTEKSSFIGSIGVYMMHIDFSENDKINGLKYTYITAQQSTEKVIGNAHEPLSEENYKIIQAELSEVCEAFISDVNKSRARNGGLDAKAFTGASFTGIKAKELGLIDAIGSMEQAITKAKNLAKTRQMGLV